MTLVVAGATRYHELDAKATACANDPEFREAAATVQRHWGCWGDADAAAERAAAVAFARAALDRPEMPEYEIMKLHWKIGRWRPGLGIPVCSVTNPGEILREEVAIARGLSLSHECAARTGRLQAQASNPLLSWANAPATGRYRAYRHVFDCEVCWHEGVGKCELFPKIATLEIDSELDPRLDPEHVG